MWECVCECVPICRVASVVWVHVHSRASGKQESALTPTLNLTLTLIWTLTLKPSLKLPTTLWTHADQMKCLYSVFMYSQRCLKLKFVHKHRQTCTYTLVSLSVEQTLIKLWLHGCRFMRKFFLIFFLVIKVERGSWLRKKLFIFYFQKNWVISSIYCKSWELKTADRCWAPSYFYQLHTYMNLFFFLQLEYQEWMYCRTNQLHSTADYKVCVTAARANQKLKVMMSVQV